MSVLGLIIQREYLLRVRKKMFFVISLLMPTLFAISLFLASSNHTEAMHESPMDVTPIISIAFSFVVYFFVLIYGQMVIHGVIEEKSNRIVEVMLSSVRPFDLMMGKIIGIGLVGVTQLLISIFLGGFVFLSKGILSPATQSMQLFILSGYINWVQLFVCLFAYFVGGYLIYASMFAMFGAAIDNPQDAQYFIMPVVLIFLFAFYAGIYCKDDPNGTFAIWCSMIPFSSPIVMMVRLPFGVPWWQLSLSITILGVSIICAVKIAAKVYRVAILMYGKKANFKDLYKWMTYK